MLDSTITFSTGIDLKISRSHKYFTSRKPEEESKHKMYLMLQSVRLTDDSTSFRSGYIGVIAHPRQLTDVNEYKFHNIPANLDLFLHKTSLYYFKCLNIYIKMYNGDIQMVIN